MRRQLRKILPVVQIKKKLAFSLLQFYDAAKPAKKALLRLTEHSELNNFTNMVAKIEIDDLLRKSKWDCKLAKNYEQPPSIQNLLVLTKSSVLENFYGELITNLTVREIHKCVDRNWTCVLLCRKNNSGGVRSRSQAKPTSCWDARNNSQAHVDVNSDVIGLINLRNSRPSWCSNSGATSRILPILTLILNSYAFSFFVRENSTVRLRFYSFHPFIFVLWIAAVTSVE